MKNVLFPSSGIKIKTTLTSAAYRRVLEAQIVTVVIIFNRV